MELRMVFFREQGFGGGGFVLQGRPTPLRTLVPHMLDLLWQTLKNTVIWRDSTYANDLTAWQKV